MASPVISSPIAGASYTFAPGESKDILVVASDPDTGPPQTVTFKAADLQGNITPVAVTVQVRDAVTFSAAPAPSGWTITQDAANPALFHVKAP